MNGLIFPAECRKGDEIKAGTATGWLVIVKFTSKPQLRADHVYGVEVGVSKLAPHRMQSAFRYLPRHALANTPIGLGRPLEVKAGELEDEWWKTPLLTSLELNGTRFFRPGRTIEVPVRGG